MLLLLLKPHPFEEEYHKKMKWNRQDKGTLCIRITINARIFYSNRWVLFVQCVEWNWIWVEAVEYNIWWILSWPQVSIVDWPPGRKRNSVFSITVMRRSIVYFYLIDRRTLWCFGTIWRSIIENRLVGDSRIGSFIQSHTLIN